MNDDVNESIDTVQENTNANIDIYDKISTILIENCISPNIKGFRYLRDCIYYAFNDINIIYNMMNGLYRMVANNYGASVCKVERSIRHAIEVAWNRSQLKYLSEELCVNVDYSVYKPSNSEFIALIAHRLLDLYRNN